MIRQYNSSLLYYGISNQIECKRVQIIVVYLHSVRECIATSPVCTHCIGNGRWHILTF
jgi:hypothetical protein